MSQRYGLRTRSLIRALSLNVVRQSVCAALVLCSPLLAADPESRTWADATGKFKIQGKFVSSADGKVTLERDGGGQVEIELKKLSAADQKYVAELEAEADNPFKVVEEDPFKPKMAAKSARAARSVPVSSSAVAEARILVPDWSSVELVPLQPENEEWKFEVGAVPPPMAQMSKRPISLPPKTDFFEGMKALVTNGASRRAVIGYLHADRMKPRTRLVLCDIEKGKALGASAVPGQFVPLSLHDDGLQVLVRREEGGGNQDRLEVWKLGRSGIEKTIQWIPYDDAKGGDRDIKWGTFIGADRVATVNGSGNLAIFELSTGKPIYSLQVQGGCLPDLSPDGKHIAFSTGKEVGVLDVDEGKVAALQSSPQIQWPVMAFSPSGQRVACCAFDKLYVWDFATGELYREIPFTGLHVMGQIVWPDDDHVLLGKHYLIELENQVRLWEYRGHEEVQSVAGATLFALSQGQDKPGALIPARVPHTGVADKLTKAMADPNFFVLKPGVTVRINANAIPDPAQRETVIGHLARKLEANGFRVGQQGTIELVASTEVGGEREVSYHIFGSFGARTYKIREHISRVKFLYGGQAAWEQQSTNIPGFLHLKEGQRVEDVLREHERPNFSYFEHVELPKLLTKPTGMVALGKSEVTVSGLK